MEINKLFKGLLIGAIIFLVLIAAALVYYKVINAGNYTSGSISSTAGYEATNARQEQEFPVVSDANAGEDINPGVKGGDIQFSPNGGDYTRKVRIKLSFSKLKSSRDDVIDSYIYYTLNGSNPTRMNGKKYPTGGINLSRAGTFTLKARLISKVGEYQGNVYSRVYTVQPEVSRLTQVSSEPVTVTTPPDSNPRVQSETREIPPQNSIITNFDSLDVSTKDDIRENMKLITLEVEDIENIKKNGDLKIHLSVSKEGQGKVMEISGFVVEPAGKMNDIKAALDLKIKGIDFNPPTFNENPVDIAVWIDFRKVAKFYEKVIFER